jgi:transcriptional regulator with GAF, ATPase, and Fis domain
MSLARLVVVEGPDAGREFELPLRGGGIGRGEGNLIQLTDPTVSRQHGLIELRDGALVWVDDSGKPRTLINGAPPTVHRLEAGDEIVLGATKLAYLPVDGVAVMKAASHVTMEVSTAALFALDGREGRDDRGLKHLAAIAELGHRLRAEAAAGRDAVARAACDAVRKALDAHRAFVLSAGPRPAPLAAAVAAGDSAQLQLPHDLIEKVLRGGVVTAETGSGTSQRALIAAPVYGSGDEVVAVLWIDRIGASWQQADAQAASCIAQLTGAALVGADARDQLARRAAALEEQLEGPAGPKELVGRSAATLRVLEFVKRVGPSDASILLGGESGSGKEMVASAIHRASRRAKGPFVAVNCAALTESLIESELFGHEKGAFTEMADRGTLFLDEIGELPLGLQTKFLRVLEERRFERVGGQKSIEVEVRVIAATNRDLAEMVKRGSFREDLFYRLSVIQLDVPPLRERLDDVPPLAEHFLARFRHQAGRRIVGFASEALAVMSRYHWPGNVRELRNAVERAIVLGERDTIQASELRSRTRRSSSRSRQPRPRPSSPSTPPDHVRRSRVHCASWRRRASSPRSLPRAATRRRLRRSSRSIARRSTRSSRTTTSVSAGSCVDGRACAVRRSGRSHHLRRSVPGPYRRPCCSSRRRDESPRARTRQTTCRYAEFLTT